MAEAKHYWLGTVTPGGAPHSRPIAGMWLDDRLYFGGSAETRRWRNLVADSRASITLEDAESAVILEGRVRFLRPDTELAERIAQESNRKYDQGQKREDYEAEQIAEFAPALAFAWTALFKDATRWRLSP
jgi:general stress protein 26